MRVRASWFTCAATLAVAAFCCSVAGQERAADGAASPETAPAAQQKPATPGVEQLEATRAQQLRLKESFIRKPETLQSMFGRQKPVPMLLPAAAGLRSRTLLDDENNWAFISADDVIHDYMMREILKLPEYGPDGRDLGSLSPVERYYARVSGGKDKRASDSILDVFNLQSLREGERNKDRDSRGNAGSGSDSSRLSGSLSDATGIPGDGPARPGSQPDFAAFGRRNDYAPETLRQVKERQEQIEAFKSALDFQAPSSPSFTPAAGSFNPAGAPAPVSVKSADSWNSFAVPGLAPAGASLGQYNPSLATPALPSAPPAPKAPNAVPPAASAQPTTPAKHAAPPNGFSIPQRAF